jgi:ornithine--oxo-acid transaminase
LEPLAERYELIRDVRGKGLMIGIEFGEPESRQLRRRWRTIERVRTGLFSQLVVVPLFHRHRILTQVAADDINVVKLLPPLVAGEEEVALFVEGLDDVMRDAHEGSGLLVEVGRTFARSALPRRAKPA